MNLLRDWRKEIVCAVCDRPVDKIETHRNIMTGDIVYNVFCHGETQEVVLGENDISFADRIELGKAFDYKALNGGRSLADPSAPQLTEEGQ